MIEDCGMNGERREARISDVKIIGKKQDQGKITFKRRERHTYGLRTKPMKEGDPGESGDIESLQCHPA